MLGDVGRTLPRVQRPSSENPQDYRLGRYERGAACHGHPTREPERVSAGDCSHSTRETHVFGAMPLGAKIAAAVVIIAVVGLAIAAIRWFKAQMR